MDSQARVIIVGAGAFGLGAAVALAERGYDNVIVLDRGEPGSGSTSKAAGILSVQTWNDDDMALILRTRGIVAALQEWGASEGLPSAPGAWRGHGGITVGGAGHDGILAAMHDRACRHNENAVLMDADEAAKRFPHFRFEAGERVLWTEGDGVLEAGDVVDLLASRARALGVEVYTDAPVARVLVDGGGLSGVALGGGEGESLAADHVILAAGAWTIRLASEAGVRLPALAYRTQLASLERAGMGTFPVLHDLVQGFYARPESSSRFFAGNGTELRPFDPDGYDETASAAFIEKTSARVLHRFTDADAMRYHHGFAGLCVGTPDRRPLVGPVATADGPIAGLHVMTGDNGFGLMRGPALGEVVADLVAGHRHPSAPGVDPRRFGTDPPQEFPLREGYGLG